MSKPRAGSAPAARGDGRARKRSASPSLFRRTAAAVTALMLGAGLALIGVAAPASAHHNTITGEAICSTDGKTVDITWTVKNSESIAETITHSSQPDVVATGTTIAPNGSSTFVQKGAALGKTHKLELTAEWTNKKTQANDGELRVSSGFCDDEDKKLTICHATGSESNPYVIETIALAAVVNAHIEHQHREDIIPAFTYKGVDYPAQGDQSRLTTGDCSKPPTEIPVDGAPTFSDTCDADIEDLNIPADTAKINWEWVEANGTITVTAIANAGYVFRPNSTTTWTYQLPDEECIEPSLDVKLLTGLCVADAPWIFFDIELIDPDGQSTGDVATLVLTDGVNTKELELGKLVDGKLEDKVLWPGASVAADGVTPTGWPGWALVGTTWVQVDDNFAWTRGDIEATIEVNPTVAVALTYPPATPECAAGPKGSGSGGSTPAAAGTGLASTGFEGTAIGIVAGIIVVAGIAFLVIARIRRNRA